MCTCGIGRVKIVLSSDNDCWESQQSLLATEISVVREREKRREERMRENVEEREKGGERERQISPRDRSFRREREREKKDTEAFPPASPFLY